MTLEVLKWPAAPGRGPRPPIVFVHGAFHGAWCWEHWGEFFAEQGWDAYALSLRGHGGSPGAERIHHWRLVDYVCDLRSVVAEIARKPVVVGHSMGGRVVQKYLETEAAAAGVLVAPSPIEDIPEVRRRMLRRHAMPLLRALFRLEPRLALPAVEDFLFRDALDPSLRDRYRALLGNESWRALRDIFRFGLHDPARVKAPMLVVAARHDTVIPVAVNERLARRYGAPCVVASGAHSLMLDPEWRDGATQIANWLTTIS